MLFRHNYKSVLTTMGTLIGLAFIATSCGNNRQAKSVVKDYLEANLTSQDYSTEFFSQVDSSFVISDSALTKMQTAAKGLKMFKATPFAKRGNQKKLYFIKTRYTISTDTIRQVFYLNADQTEIVCVKQDV